jgi:(p)ppGpp synthase/HD superfamily hydrolase
MIQKNSSSLHLGDRFLRAVSYARDLHVENRKATQVPYMAHLLGVASLVMGESGYVSFPITEDEVNAALLHDAAEDCGGAARLNDIQAVFGDFVADHVKGCTDTFQDPKPAWHSRKQAYIERLPNETAQTRLISAADKLHNARAILDDFRCIGDKVWNRFRAGRDEHLWYYGKLADVFRECGTNRIVEELGRVVATLKVESCGIRHQEADFDKDQTTLGKDYIRNSPVSAGTTEPGHGISIVGVTNRKTDEE